MNKLIKTTVLAITLFAGGTSLTACENSKQETKLFAPKEPNYDKSLTLEKIKDSVIYLKPNN